MNTNWVHLIPQLSWRILLHEFFMYDFCGLVFHRQVSASAMRSAVGIPGAIQLIQRFGGSTSATQLEQCPI